MFGGEGDGLVHVEDDKVGVRADLDDPLLGIQAEMNRGVSAADLDDPLDGAGLPQSDLLIPSASGLDRWPMVKARVAPERCGGPMRQHLGPLI